MIVNGATTLRTLVRENAWAVLTAVSLVALVEAIDAYLDVIDLKQRAVFSMAALGLLTTALSIFLVFRVNEAYSRWWEARILWGGIVNASRTFARQATSLIAAGDERSGNVAQITQELVYRHLAFINALRIHLRKETDYGDLAQFLTKEQYSRLSPAVNKPAQLVQCQSEQIAELRRQGFIDGFAHIMFDSTLTELYSLQGGCERIKNTVFPDRVAYFTRVVAWAMAVLLPICILEADDRFDMIDFVVVPAMMLVFIVTERLGAELKNPFENRPNDTPMSALCRSIEIDLRQQLGEQDLPKPLTPVRGVLL